MAVSREPYVVARAYADEHDWNVEVRSLPMGGPASKTPQRASRTPWVFVLDEQGRVVANTSGYDLDLAVSAFSGMDATQ